MKIKKIFLIIVMIICLTGCTNINNLTYNDIVNNLSTQPKPANVYKKGHQFYLPKGMAIEDSGLSYSILSSFDTFYYLYVDVVSYNAKKDFKYEVNKDALYSTLINYEGKSGYAEIKLWENEQYLIEIIYNYAKIEVMVDEHLIKKALINSINILNSIKYNDQIIENLLQDDNLTYTEEVFDMFEEIKDDSTIIDIETEEDKNEKVENEIIDTDFLN